MADLTFAQAAGPVSVYNETSGNQLGINSDGSLTAKPYAATTTATQVVTLTSTQSALPSVPLSGRRTLVVQNTFDSPVYVGSTGISAGGASSGICLPTKNSIAVFEVDSTAIIYGIIASGSQDVVVFEMA